MLSSDLGLDQDPLGDGPSPVVVTDNGAYLSTASADDLAEGENTPAQDLVAFAKALTAAGAKLFSAAWCPACTAQKKLFEDGGDFLPFIEVTNPDRSPNQIAIDEGITHYPTWQFPDGSRLVGTQSLETLSARAGVAIPTSVNPFVAPIGQQTVLGGSPLHVALNGYDPNGGSLTYTVSSSNPSLVQAVVLSGNRSVEVDFSGWGSLVFELFEDRVPGATSRFLTLVGQGFYDAANNTPPVGVHRSINNFMFQFGDPTGTGGGGSPLEDIDDDFHVDLQHNKAGMLAWAKSALNQSTTIDDSANSQVYVTDVPTRHLDFNHPVFGVLTEGDKIRDAINLAAVNASNQPTLPITIQSARVFQDQENRVLMLKAAENAAGEADITVTVRDGDGNQYVEMFHVIVSPDPYDGGPFLNDIPPIVTTMNVPATFQLSATDVEGNAVRFDGVRLGSVAYTYSVDDTTGQVTVTPPTDFIGTMDVQVRVRPQGTSNTQDLYDTQIVTVTVLPPAPLAVDLLAASDSGASNSDNVTNAAEMGFRITNVQNGAIVRLHRGSLIIGQATAAGSEVTITTSSLAQLGDGTSSIHATQIVNGLESAASATLAVTVDQTPPPPFTSTPPTVGKVGQVVSYDAVNSQEGVAGTTYSLVGVKGNATINPASGLFTWTPVAADIGSNSFTIVLTDVAGNTRSQSMAIGVQTDADVAFRIVLTDLSGAAVMAVDMGDQFLAKVYVQDQRSVPRGVFAAFLDVLYSSTLVSLDGSLIFGSDYPNNRKGDTSTAGVINEAGAVGGFTELGGSEYLLLTVPLRAIGTGVATISADPADLHPQNDILTYDVVTVLPEDVIYGAATLTINVAFDLENDLFNVDEDSTNTSLNVLGNDDLTAASGNALITAVGTPSHGGTVSIAADGKSVLYRPLGDFFGSETFTYRVSDNAGFAEATVTVQVAPINDPPTAVNDEFNVPEDSQNFSLNVLSNDLIAPDTGETLSVIGVGTPSHGGTVTIPQEKNRVLYTPASNFSGVETFTYTISDGKGGTSQATATIHVTEANDPPAARDDLFQADEDSSENVLDPLANDSTLGDPGETLTITAVSTPDKNGTVTIADGGLTLRYTPAPNFFGIDRFTYTISDGRGGTAQAAIAVNVRAVNDPPKANNDTFTVSKGASAQQLNVLANDSSEPDAQEVLTITQVGATSAGGTVVIAADGLSVNYTPAAGYTGTDTFTYTIRDPGGATAQATATVTVLDFISSNLSGYVYLDVNNDGVKNPAETPVGGVVVSLQGTTSGGQTVSLQQTTDARGFYQFTNLAPGTYFVIETQPVFLLDGIDSPGPFGTVAGNDRLRIELPQDTNATNINFGERGRAAHQITVLDFLASSRSDSVLSATNEASGSQWYAIESGWKEAKTMEVALVQAATAAKLDVTDVQQRSYSATVPFSASSDVARVTSSGQYHLLRFLAPPHRLFPNADCGCDAAGSEAEQAEGEQPLFALAANNGAEGESTLLPDAHRTLAPTNGLGGTPAGLWEVEGEGEAEPAIWATPADGYLATELLMAESGAGAPTGDGIDDLPDIAADDDQAFLDAIDQLMAELTG